MGAQINIADASVYPASMELHNKTVNMIANLWNCPAPEDGGDHCGAGTVGSTEACLLAGLALKFRWRRWFAAKHGLNEEQVLAVRPNLVIGTHFQAAWEKMFRYFDIEPRLAQSNLVDDKMAACPKALAGLCDEKTIGVVGILGNHYNGTYDPIWDINEEVEKLNKKNGWQIGIHVDGASGGFIAPFQQMSGKFDKEFDFRLKNVLSMSASGHKFGESICGTGWVVFRQRKDLAEHIAVTVTYLGGQSDSYTLNFSRPASGPYIQFYKLMRLGKSGYMSKTENQMYVAKYIRDFLKAQVHEPTGKPRFQLLDCGDSGCLPVVSARLNPELCLNYNDVDMQHALSESHWYVSGYSLGFQNPLNEEFEPLFSDVEAAATMFRVVVKSNLTQGLAEDLTKKISNVLTVLDSMEGQYQSMRTKHSIAESAKAMSHSETQVPILEALNKFKHSHVFAHLARKKKGDRGKKNAIVTQSIC